MTADGLQARDPGLATGLSLLVPITLSTMAIVLLAPILPQLMAEFREVPNADYWAPMVLTVPALCVALFSIPGGALGDRFGRRRLLIASLGVYGIVGIAPIFLTSLTAILVSRMFVGIAEALIMVTTTTLIGDYYSGTRRDKWLAAQTAVASVSALLFFNIGGLLGRTGWRMPFWIYTSALGMLVLVLLFTWEPAANRADVAVLAPTGEGAPFPWRRMAAIIPITIFGAVLFYTVQIQASSGLAAHGVTNPAEAGFLTSIASLAVPFGTYVYGKLGHGRVARLLCAEFAMLGVGFVGMSVAAGVPGFLAACTLNQLGAGLLLPTLLVWAMRQLSFAVRARGIGLWQSAFALGQFLSPVAIAAIARQVGGLLPSFQWLGFASAAAAVATLLLMLRPGSGPQPVAAA